MKVLCIAVDSHSGERLDVTTIEVDPVKFQQDTLPEKGFWGGYRVNLCYSDDLEVGPTREDLEYALEDAFSPGRDPSDYLP